MQLDRRKVLLSGVIAGLEANGVRAEGASKPSARLICLPTRVFKVPDLVREGTETWFATLIVTADAEIALDPTEFETMLFAKEAEICRSRYPASALPAIMQRGPVQKEGEVWLLGFRLIGREPAAAKADRMRCTVRFADRGALKMDIPIDVYTQHTELIFPFHGHGVVSQGGAANGGHMNDSGQFAIDALGAAPNYAVLTGSDFGSNSDLVGFGRELVAPAAGVVVKARGDRPDQPTPGVNDERYLAPEIGGGDPGNHVVIDHGDGEFSLIAHMKAGSLAVRRKQRVRQGELIGLLGNSGDSSAPHVHHQLQDGPDWQTANALPCRYANINEQRLERGVFFRAV